MYKYEIESMQLMHELEENFIIHITLDSKKKHRIVLKFTRSFIDDLFKGAPSGEEIEKWFKKILSENDNFLLIRLTRIALGNESIKKQLKMQENGLFSIDYRKWQEIMKRIEDEELELILAEGLSYE